MVLDIFGGQRGLINCVLGSRKQQHTRQEKQHTESETATSTEKAKCTSTEQQKQQKAQTGASCTNNKEYQTPKLSAKAAQTTAKAGHQEEHAQQQQKLHKQNKQQRKQPKQQQRHEGPEGGHHRSLCALIGVFSWISVVFSMLF